MRIFHTFFNCKDLSHFTLLLQILSICRDRVTATRPTPIELAKPRILLNWTASANNSGFFHTQHLGDQEPNPENNITCVGEAPDLRLPLLADGFNPNTASMQHLCAKTQYNGGPLGEHAGGYCWTRPGVASYNNLGNDTTGDVGFDLHARARASSMLQNPRFLLACFYRCFCNYGLENPSVQPKSKYAYFRTSMTRSLFSYELQLDIDNDFTVPTLWKSGKQGARHVASTRVPERSEIDQTSNPSARMGRRYITLDVGNEIECEGDLPTFVLPAPYATSDFNSLQELCATQLNGGNMYANAGGYCHRSVTANGPSNTVWFADDQTPRLGWTWAGGNFFASASIRFHCWQHCACRNVKPTRDNATTLLWAFVHGHALAYRHRGEIVVQQETGPVPPGGERETTVLPPQNGPGSPSGTCGVNGEEFCPQNWPSDIYGEIPRAPPDTTEIIESKAATGQTYVCGNTCKGAADCSSSNSQQDCSCALPTTDDAKTLGLDPVAPIAVCLALFAASMPKHSLGGKRALVDGGTRDVESSTSRAAKYAFVDSRGVPHTCKCNATFVSDECCRSGDGMVFL